MTQKRAFIGFEAAHKITQQIQSEQQSQIGKVTEDSQKLSREEMMRTASFWPWKSHYFWKRLTMCLSEKLHTKHTLHACMHAHLNLVYNDYRTHKTYTFIPFTALHLQQTLLHVHLQQITQCYPSTAT